MHHLSPALPLFVLHNFSPHFFPLLPAPTGSLPVLISPHPRLSPSSRVFILFCGELCYDKDFTPRMYAVMPLWGMGALTALPAPPGLPFPGREAGRRSWARVEGVIPLHTLSCPAWCWWKHTHTHTQIEDSLIHAAWFNSFFLPCSHGQLKMLTWDFLAQSIFLSHWYYLIYRRFSVLQDCLPSITKSQGTKTFSWSHVGLNGRMANFIQQIYPGFFHSSHQRVVSERECTPSPCGVFSITEVHSRCLCLSSPWTKTTNTFQCSQGNSLHLSHHVRISHPKTQTAKARGIFGLCKQQLMNWFKWKVVVI